MRGVDTKFRKTWRKLNKIENILTCWSVAQACSNDDKNMRQKISLYCPFKCRFFHFFYWKVEVYGMDNSCVCVFGSFLVRIRVLFGPDSGPFWSVFGSFLVCTYSGSFGPYSGPFWSVFGSFLVRIRVLLVRTRVHFFISAIFYILDTDPGDPP